MAQIASPVIDTSLQLPPTISVLAIDTNLAVLELIKSMRNLYGYQVMACSESLSALNVLRERKVRIDLILIEAHMPMMDGYEFLQFVKQEGLNIPLIMMSLDYSRPSVAKALRLGACDYWFKPLCEYQFNIMWTHMVFNKYISEDKRQEHIGRPEDDDRIRGRSGNSEFASSIVDRSNSNFREADDVNESRNSNPPSTKKNRVVWSPELHLVFLKAIDKIGIENAVPKKILEVMNIPGLERGHVASHLQKYRKYWKERETKRQQQNDMSLASGNIEPRMHASGTIHLQPFPATTQTEHALAHDHPFATFPNTVITDNFSHSVGILDDASVYRFCSLSDTGLVDNPAMLQRNNMQQPVMHHDQIHPINFQSSSMLISGNPTAVPENYNFGMNIDNGLIPPQSIQGGNNIGEVILNQYTARASIYYPQFQNAGLPSSAVRSFAASDFSFPNLSTDIDDKTTNG